MSVIGNFKNSIGRALNLLSTEKTEESTIKNLKVLIKDRDDLKPLVPMLDSGELTHEQFISICTLELGREIIKLRDDEIRKELTAW